MTARKPAIGFIFLTLLLDVMGIGLIIPVAPKLVEQLMGVAEQDAAPYVGALSATYAAMLFLFAPVLGALSDRFGRRPVILVSLFGSGLDYFAAAMAPTIWILFITRAINGISGASMTAAAAYIADITPPEKRAAGFGMIGAAFGLGFIIGPLCGGVLGKYDIHYPFYAAGTLTLLNWFYGYMVLPESNPPERRVPLSIGRMNPVGVFVYLSRYPFVMILGGALFLMNVAQFALHATWVLYTSYRYKWGTLDTGLSLALVGLMAALVQGGLARKLIPALGEKKSLLLGLVIGVAAYAGYGAATQGWMIYAIIVIASLGGIAQPAAQSLITKAVRADEQGQTQGALTGLQSLANILGPIMGAFAFQTFAHDTARVHVPGASFFASAIVASVGLAVAAWAMSRRDAPTALGVKDAA